MANYLALLGWGPPDGVEVRPMAEIVDLFRLEDVTKAAAFFDLKKLAHISGEWIRRLETDDFVQRCGPWLERGPWAPENFDPDAFRTSAPVVQERVTTLLHRLAVPPPHSVFVIGGSGRVASAAIDIVDPPDLLSLQMFDANANGKVNLVTATFDDTLAAYSAATTPWTLLSAPSGATLASVSVAGITATLTLDEGAGAATTAVGSFTVSLAGNAAGIRDLFGHTSSFPATAPLDRAAPAATAAVMRDVNANGKIDQVDVTFSEPLAPYTAGPTPWALISSPSGAALQSVTVSGADATLTLTEGGGAPDTAVGSFTIALSASIVGIRDAAGNLASYSAAAPTDGAGPVTTVIVDTNGATNGLFEPGDTLSITFSEAVAPASVPANVTVTLSDPPGAGDDTLTIGGVTNGARPTGSNAYLTAERTSANFASTTTLTNANRTVTVVLGAACTGAGCVALDRATGNPTFSFAPATTLTDPALNSATGTHTQILRLF